MQKGSLSILVFGEARPADGPFPIAKELHLHWGLLEAHGGIVQGETHAARGASPSCVFPMCFSCINTQAPTAWGQGAVFLPHGLHTLLPGPRMYGHEGEEEGSRVSCGQHPLGVTTAVALMPTDRLPNLAVRKDLALLLRIPCCHNARHEPIKHPPKICLALITQCTLHKYQCPWWF